VRSPAVQALDLAVEVLHIDDVDRAATTARMPFPHRARAAQRRPSSVTSHAAVGVLCGAPARTPEAA
jgi:hypothetical protein